jgi:signal transduction histidine kinase
VIPPLEDIRRAERVMVLVRGVGAVFAFAQILAYRELPYPPGVKASALALAGILVLANVAIWVIQDRVRTRRQALRLSLGALILDVAVASGIVWAYAFDPLSALWAVLFILPMEGAIRFGLWGALWTWAAVTVLYVGRELWRIDVFPRSVHGPGGFGFQLESISFRMGIGLLIALVAGLMARNLRRQRARLSDTLDEVSRIDALRANLVATLAHDVRGPLTSIRGILTTLRRHGEDLEEGTREELTRTADEQAERLERLATGLLDLARLEQGRMELRLQEVRLRDAVAKGLQFTGHQERFEMEIPPDLTVRADPQRLEQIVVNLAANSLTHGGPPFRVEAASADGHVDLRFVDEGPGVPETHVSELFEPFRTEDTTGSVGLGLAIVRALAEAQGGEVSYQPNQPRGACFRVLLPSG